MSGIAIEQRRVALSQELDNIATKRPYDAKWFDLTSEGKLTLRDRPEGCCLCNLAVICEVASRFWEWLVAFFSSGPSSLETRMVELTKEVATYLGQESDTNARNLFLQKYTAPLNELGRMAERMEGAGRILQTSAEAIQSVWGGLVMRKFVYTPYARYEDGDIYYTPQNTLLLKNSLQNPTATVSFQFDGVRRGYVGWKSEKAAFNIAEGAPSRFNIVDNSEFRCRSDQYKVAVQAVIRRKIDIPLHELTQSYTIKVDHLGRMAVEPGAPKADQNRPLLTFVNEGDKEVLVRLGEFPSDKLNFSAFSGRPLAPGASEEYELTYACSDHKSWPVVTSVCTDSTPLIFGCYNKGEYLCELNNQGKIITRDKHGE